MSNIESMKMLVRPLWRLFKRVIRYDYIKVLQYFLHDANRFWRYSGIRPNRGRESSLAQIIMDYHVLEKGLTMPNRRLGFGKSPARSLVSGVDRFTKLYGLHDSQVIHAIGVIKEYKSLHDLSKYDYSEDKEYWKSIRDFCERYPSVPITQQMHITRVEFYKERNSSFPQFAKARHTLRHYSDATISVKRLRDAVELAMTAPSACNRQHVRVICVSNRVLCHEILAFQGGSRGFGEYADKLLIVTADLQDVTELRERTDAFVNGGIFLMNLCYSLFYYQIAHCILNWSAEFERDRQLRSVVNIPDTETVIALLSCGESPDEFDVAMSPRKDIDKIFRVV